VRHIHIRLMLRRVLGLGKLFILAYFEKAREAEEGVA
jgi:hypothetical protein